MKCIRFYRIGLLTVLALAAPAALAVAATATWNVDADGNWTTPGNWTAGGPPNGAAEIANLTFDITADRTITLDAPQTVGGLNIGDATGTSAYTVSGANTLSTGGAATILKSLSTTNTAHDLIAVPVTLGGNLIIDQKARDGGVLEFSGSIGDDGSARSVTIYGNGSHSSSTAALVIFSNANTYGGTTTLGSGGIGGATDGNGGHLLITHSQALGTGGVAFLSGANNPRLELSGGITVNNNVTTIQGSTNSTRARIVSESGANEWAGNITGISTGGSEYPIESAGTAPGDFFTISGNIHNNRASEAGFRNLHFRGGGDGEVTGNITQNVGGSQFAVYKANAGTWTFSGANGYTGPTNVEFGTLLINGTHNGGAAYSVTDDATLGGDGVITLAVDQNVTILAGGNLSPGDAGLAGELTFALSGTGSLDMSLATNNTGALNFGLDTELTSDLVTLTTGTLNIGTLDFEDFSFTALGGFGPGTYVLFDTNASIVGSLGNASGLVSGLSATLSIEGGQDIVLTVVPEPSSIVMLSIASLGMGLVRAKRRK